MGQLATDANVKLRDHVVQGVPSSGPYQILKSGLRALFALADSLVTSLTLRVTNLEAGVVIGDTLDVGRYVGLARTGSATADHLDMTPLIEGIVTALSVGDLFMVRTIEANTVADPTATIAGLGPYDVLDAGGDPPGVGAWGVNSSLFLRWDGTAFRIVQVVRAPTDVLPLPTYLVPIEQVNADTNAWVASSVSGSEIIGGGETSIFSLVVEQVSIEGGVTLDVNGVTSGDPRQLLFPDGSQVGIGDLPLGTGVLIDYATTGALAGQFVILSPTQISATAAADNGRQDFYTAMNARIYVQRSFGK